MKLWIDDIRPAPLGYSEFKSVNQTIEFIETFEHRIARLKELRNNDTTKYYPEIELIDIDHDAGEYACCGGDYIKLLDWLEETGRNYPIHIHSMNPVGVENMRRIIQRNGWKEI
jgi:hypothetical protein